MASLLMDPLGYRRLVLDDGWTMEEYAAWMAQLTAASFLPDPTIPDRSGEGSEAIRR